MSCLLCGSPRMPNGPRGVRRTSITTWCLPWEDGSPLDPGQLTKRFRQLAKEAGLPPARLHDLRHASASLMIQAGVPLALVSKRLGHSSISITSDVYGHLLEGAGREAAERAAALIPRRPQLVTGGDAQTI